MDFALYRLSDNLLVLVCEAETAVAIVKFDASAVVRVLDIRDELKVLVAGVTFPLTLAYSPAAAGEAEPTGRFAATLPAALNVATGKRYVLTGHANGGVGRERTFRAPLRIVETL